jgi:hypothetical protein
MEIFRGRASDGEIFNIKKKIRKEESQGLDF